MMSIRFNFIVSNLRALRFAKFFSFTAIAIIVFAISINSYGDDLATSFEFDDTSGEFTLGTSPQSATFTGGEAKSVGNFDLYHTGFRSWMIESGNAGSITLETPSQKVNLFFRDASSGVGSVLTLLDVNGQEVATFNGTETDWREVDITLESEAPRIKSITLANNDTSLGNYTVIDDFSFCIDVDGDVSGIENPIPRPIMEGEISIALETVATGLTAPNWGTAAPGNPDHLFVSDQNGILWRIDLTTGEKIVFLDVRDRLVDLGIRGPGTFDERGLLGVAFHPDYVENGLLYTYTSELVNGLADFSTMPDGSVANHQSVITEWRVPNPDDPDSLVDPTRSRELMRIDQPQFNHDGGAINFGPDNKLYISLGDGGAGDDQGIGHSHIGNGYDLSNVLGTILRINPLGRNSKNGEYGTPNGNPFHLHNLLPNEIYAYGFRNPFRFSFDRETGLLYVGDVGQNDLEEIDVVKKGKNHGWPIKEGTFFFDQNGDDRGFVTRNAPSFPRGWVSPISQYDHDEGTAIIGGFVYRGTSIQSLIGHYVFGDFARTFSNDGRLFFLDGATMSIVKEFEIVGQSGLGLSLLGFGQDARGELYVLGNTTGVPFGDTGVVQRIILAP